MFLRSEPFCDIYLCRCRMCDHYRYVKIIGFVLNSHGIIFCIVIIITTTIYKSRSTNKLILQWHKITVLVKRTSVVKLPTHVAASYVHAHHTCRSPILLQSWKDIIIINITIIVTTLLEQFLIVVVIRKTQHHLGLSKMKIIKPESFDEIVCAIILLLFYRYCHVKTVRGIIRVCCCSCT